MQTSDNVEQAMLRYYAQRAAEYERVFDKPHRQPDIAALKVWLRGQFAGRHVLEVATGTGFWLPEATAEVASWLGTDLSAEVLAIARLKPLDFTRVGFELANAYALGATLARRSFDAAFAGLWFSHVPLARRADWLRQLHAQLGRGARVVLIDNRYVDGDSTPVTRFDAEGNGFQRRRLSDGSEHEVLKNFPTADEFAALLGGRPFEFRELDHFWTLVYEV